MPIDASLKADYRARIEAELRRDILPFWLKHTPDRQNGGFYGAITNDLQILDDVPRALVLTARILWTFSAAYRAYGDAAYLDMARHAYHDLITRFYDRQYGGFYWWVDRTGEMMEDRKQIYGQGFALYGLSEYYLACGDAAALTHAQQLLALLDRHALDPLHGGYVEACARDWSAAPDMRLSEKEPNVVKSMNTMLHMVEPLTNLVRAWDAPESRRALIGAHDAFLQHVIDPHSNATRLFFEMDWTSVGDAVSYGHDIEASWLLVEAAEVIGDPQRLAHTRQLALRMARAASVALDEDGALLYEAEPSGFTNTDKIWWAQAEALVGFYNAAQIATDAAEAEHFARIALRVWDFIEDHLIDRQYGDWFKGMSRARVVDQEHYKVGPWDCPYHHARACLEMIHRLK